jgi:hypothetical protein
MSNLVKLPENNPQGVVGYVLAWLLGIPISILLIVFLLRGCD